MLDKDIKISMRCANGVPHHAHIILGVLLSWFRYIQSQQKYSTHDSNDVGGKPNTRGMESTGKEKLPGITLLVRVHIQFLMGSS